MGEMADYYLEQEDPFDERETYWRGEGQLLDGPPYDQRSRPTATVWVTRQGKRVPVTEMSDSYLTNAISYMRRTASVCLTWPALLAEAEKRGLQTDARLLAEVERVRKEAKR